MEKTSFLCIGKACFHIPDLPNAETASVTIKEYSMGFFSSKLADSLSDIIAIPNQNVVFHKIARNTNELLESTETYIILGHNDYAECVAQGNQKNDIPAELYHRGARFSSSSYITGEVFRTENAFIMNNYQSWEQHYIGLIPSENLVYHAMGCPLIIDTKVYGVIVTIRTENRPYTAMDFDRFQTFGMLASIELKNAINLEQLNEMNHQLQELNSIKTMRLSEKELELEHQNQKLQEKNDELRKLIRHMDDIENDSRRVLAEYMHDDTLQRLYGVSLLIQAALVSVQDSVSPTADLLKQCASEMKDTEESLRYTISTLRPFLLRSKDLIKAMHEFLLETARKAGITIEFENHYPYKIAVNEDTMAIYQILREAVINARSHSHCQTISVCIDLLEEPQEDSTPLRMLIVEIKDDGVGFCSERKENHYGIELMKTRAEVLGGEVRIESSPGAGTMVIMKIPEAVVVKDMGESGTL